MTGHRQSSDRSSQGRDHAHAPRQSTSNQHHTRSSDEHARGGVAALAPPPAPASSSLHVGEEPSPAGDGKNGKGNSGHGGLGGSTKTIQSYFYRPSNTSAVRTLASSYGPLNDASGHSHALVGAPPGEEVDLSGWDGDSASGHGESHPPGNSAQPVIKVGRTASTGMLGSGVGRGGGGSDTGSLQRRSATLENESTGHEQGSARKRGGSGVGSFAGRDGSHKALNNESGGEELAATRAKEAEAQVVQLRKELDRANLERGSMESMVRMEGTVFIPSGASHALLYTRFALAESRVSRRLSFPLTKALPYNAKQADSLRKQLDSKIDEFKAKEADRDAQKARLTVVAENLLRKVCLGSIMNGGWGGNGCMLKPSRWGSIIVFQTHICFPCMTEMVGVS